MKIEDLKTWNDLQTYLLERQDMATDERSNANPSFTKEDYWNSLIDQSMKYFGNDLPIRTRDLLIKTVKKDFGV